jgi:hypothetical protein
VRREKHEQKREKSLHERYGSSGAKIASAAKKFGSFHEKGEFHLLS